MANNVLAVGEPALTMELITCKETQAIVARLLYPERCCDDGFASAHRAVAAQLDASAAASVVHDFSRVSSFVGWAQREVLGDARALSQARSFERVAFVCGEMPTVLTTVNSLLWLSPVKPARAFASADAAVRWCCGDGVD